MIGCHYDFDSDRWVMPTYAEIARLNAKPGDVLDVSVGASAEVMGDGSPWIPSTEDLEAIRDDFESALAMDYKLLVHHLGINVQVIGQDLHSDQFKDWLSARPTVEAGVVGDIVYRAKRRMAERLGL